MLRSILVIVSIVVGSINASSLCSCKGEPKDCVFIHGTGLHQVKDPTTTFKFYWGKIHNHAPCCRSIKFLHLDTINLPWYDDGNARSICQVAASEQDNTIRNTIIVAHSMGNLMFSHAIGTGICHIDPKTTEWVALQAPFEGSSGSHQIIKRCNIVQKILRRFITFVKCCNDDGSPTGSYNSLPAQYSEYSTPELDERFAQAQETAKTYVTAGLCGTSSKGLWSTYSIVMKVSSMLGSIPSPSDGMVPLSSCMLNNTYSSNVLNNRFYKEAINHADGSFRNGNGHSGRPQEWFECLF